MPDGPVDISRLAAALEVLADQLAATRATIEGLRLDVAAPVRGAGARSAVGGRASDLGTAPPAEDPPVEAAEAAPTTVPRSQVASLAGVPLLSAGLVEVVVGPIVDLDELDAVAAQVARFQGVSGVTVHRLERADALLLVELAHPTPLASVLREHLGRPVASCRLAEGRIVVELAPE